MKNVYPFILLLVCLILNSCNSSTNKSSLENQVIESMRASNVEQGLTGVTIQRLDLNKENDNFYIGRLYTLEDGNQLYYDVEVEVMNDVFEWRVLTLGDLVDSSVDSRPFTEEEKSYTDEVVQKDYCDLSQQKMFEYLTSTNFNINGNGSVNFSKSYDYASKQWTEGVVTISGGGQGVSGKYSISGINSIYLKDVIATSGSYDASNNNGSSGLFILNCDGSMTGTLSDGNNYREYTFFPK